MKTLFTLLAASIILFSSCTTAYKTGQTPDDVYYSPERPQEEYVRTETQDEPEYRYDDEYYEERLVRMKIRNRYRWSDLDDWYYYNNRYNYYGGGYYSWNNPWNSYTYWNYYYNPYCPKTIVVNPKVTAYNKPRTFNLNAYNPPSSNTNSKINGMSNNKNRNFSGNSNSGSNRDAGSSLRDIFKGSSNNGSSSSNSGSSTKSSSSGSSSSGNSSSGSSKSGSSGNAPARKF